MTKAATAVPSGPALAAVARDITRLFAEREELVKAAWDAGMTPADILANIGEHTTRTVNDILIEHQKVRQAEAFAATAELWKWGAVIEDRYGLRWRADFSERRGKGWFCRSVGLRVYLDGTAMAARGPLKPIRVDKVLSGPGAKIERELGQAEDDAVTVSPAEDPEDPPVAVAGDDPAPGVS
jgi:hypothetical protein